MCWMTQFGVWRKGGGEGAMYFRGSETEQDAKKRKERKKKKQLTHSAGESLFFA